MTSFLPITPGFQKEELFIKEDTRCDITSLWKHSISVLIWFFFFSKLKSLCRVQVCVCLFYLDHLISLGLWVSASHGQNSDLLCLWAAVSKREGHFPVCGAVCGVRSTNTHTCELRVEIHILTEVWYALII